MLSLDGPSLKLGRIADIPIKIHWTFSFFLIFISFIAYVDRIPSNHLFGFFSYIVLLFVFVIMHEYGHALTARRYGIVTRDIIISPIGGIARLERLPNNPLHELYIALAGPAVNVFLTIVFLAIQLFTAHEIFPTSDRIDLSSTSNYIGYLLAFNIVLVVFNMIPAFPMDGGRVLRSLLTMLFKDRLRATKWAVRIGQLIAIGFLITAIFFEIYMLAFIGIFVFFTAKSELSQLEIWKKMNATLVDEIVQPYEEFVIQEDLTLENVIETKGLSNFLVSDSEGKINGALPLLFLQSAKNHNQLGEKVSVRKNQSYGVVSSNYTLAQAFNMLNENGWVIAEVTDNLGNKKGVVDRQLLEKFISSK